jgi:hypothetical protein
VAASTRGRPPDLAAVVPTRGLTAGPG